jgi:hypothetical protein
MKPEFCYLLSKDTQENFSRDVSIFIAILSYELDRDGRNFIESFDFNEFTFEENLNFPATIKIKDLENVLKEGQRAIAINKLLINF